MKKFLVRLTVQLLAVIVFTSGSFTVFGKTTDTNETYQKVISKPQVVEVKEEIKEEVIIPETKEDSIIENNPKVLIPEITGNRIVIGNILNKNLMNDTGDYFYLNHDINGNYDGVGVPFIDSRTNFNTSKTIIYAHSSTNGNGPFQVLQNYHNNPGYYNSNPYIEIYYDNNYYKYQIFSVYVSIADSEESPGLEYFRNIDYDNETWEEAINNYKNNSEYDTGVSVSGSDKIIILQTCSMDSNYYEKYYRYNLLIMGKLV